MFRHLSIVLVTAAVVALPFIFRRPQSAGSWKPGDPVLVIISPHNEAIRYEFGEAFSAWHERRYGRPVKVDWRTIGGTTEIMRYLAGEFVASFQAWRRSEGRPWPSGGGDLLLDPRFKPDAPPDAASTSPDARRAWETQRDLHQAFRRSDDPRRFGARIDLFFGGGSYDHEKAFAQGMTVAPWPRESPPPDTLSAPDGKALIPEGLAGEVWRTDVFFGAALSTFGICYNSDRLKDLGITNPPARWEDLADTAYCGQLGVADPTKSGSISKAFEVIIHEQCHKAVREAGFSPAQSDEFEQRIRRARLPEGTLPEGVPPAYQQAVEEGWLAGVRLIQRLGANARYFTDSASAVPVDVSMGNAAAGLAIDFYGRCQAQMSRAPDGTERMVYVTPVGGSSVSADPISLLRGAEHRDIAVRFMTFVLGEDGQKLWTYAPGTPGGPRKFALRRLPIRRDFYSSDDAPMEAAHRRHAACASDRLGDPNVDPYALAARFHYYPRWTARHFNIQRDLIRAMCLDSGEELRAAWRAICARGGPAALPEAVAALGRMPENPEPLTWASALRSAKQADRLEYMREWTTAFRRNYDEARRLAEAGR